VKAIEHYSYTIDGNNAVRVWDNRGMNESTPPFLFQPDYPDSKPWENAAAAETWVIKFINDMISAENALAAAEE
jgi:hypothetical protein